MNSLRKLYAPFVLFALSLFLVSVLGLSMTACTTQLTPVQAALAELEAGGEEIPVELKYRAAAEDWDQFTADITAYALAPSVTPDEKRRIAEVMRRANAELRLFDEQRKAGLAQIDQFSVVTQLIRRSISELCVSRPDVQGCIGRPLLLPN